MAARYRWQMARHGAGVILALLGMAMLAPSARASCGDYVTVGQVPGGHPVLAASVSATEHPSPAHHHTPCSGPFCSNRSQPIPLIPVVSAPVRCDLWGCVPLLARLTEANLLAGLPDEALGTPVHRPLRIYHPPR